MCVHELVYVTVIPVVRLSELDIWHVNKGLLTFVCFLIVEYQNYIAFIAHLKLNSVDHNLTSLTLVLHFEGNRFRTVNIS